MDTFARPLHYNRACLTGTVAQSPGPSHANHGQSFYRLVLSVPRLSGQCDLLPVLLPSEPLPVLPSEPPSVLPSEPLPVLLRLRRLLLLLHRIRCHSQ